MEIKYIVKSLIAVAEVEARQPGAMPLHDQLHYVAAKELERLQECLNDAMDRNAQMHVELEQVKRVANDQAALADTFSRAFDIGIENDLTCKELKATIYAAAKRQGVD